MANTEIIKVLQLVREAKEGVNEALNRSPGDRTLERLSTILEAVEGTLILSAVQEQVAQLRQQQLQLEELNVGLKTEIAGVKAVSERVGRAATALGILVDIIAKAGSLAAM